MLARPALPAPLASLVLGLAAACGGGAAQAPAPGAPAAAPLQATDDGCPSVGGKIAALVRLGEPNMPPDLEPRLAAAIGERCTTDAWAPQVRACFAQLTDPAGADACGDQLTEAQQRALGERMLQTVQPPGAPPPGAPPPGAAPAPGAEATPGPAPSAAPANPY